MQTDIGITFEEGCKLYIENCQQRNLRADTVRHYRQSYDQFFKYFDPDMPLTESALEDRIISKKTMDSQKIFNLCTKATERKVLTIHTYRRELFAQ